MGVKYFDNVCFNNDSVLIGDFCKFHTMHWPRFIQETIPMYLLLTLITKNMSLILVTVYKHLIKYC